MIVLINSCLPTAAASDLSIFGALLLLLLLLLLLEKRKNVNRCLVYMPSPSPLNDRTRIHSLPTSHACSLPPLRPRDPVSLP